jgi:hypothetical protein
VSHREERFFASNVVRSEPAALILRSTEEDDGSLLGLGK